MVDISAISVAAITVNRLSARPRKGKLGDSGFSFRIPNKAG